MIMNGTNVPQDSNQDDERIEFDDIGQYLPIGRMNQKYDKYIDDDKYYTGLSQPENDTIEDKKCICEIRELMANGCKCGGK